MYFLIIKINFWGDLSDISPTDTHVSRFVDLMGLKAETFSVVNYCDLLLGCEITLKTFVDSFTGHMCFSVFCPFIV